MLTDVREPGSGVYSALPARDFGAERGESGSGPVVDVPQQPRGDDGCPSLE